MMDTTLPGQRELTFETMARVRFTLLIGTASIFGVFAGYSPIAAAASLMLLSLIALLYFRPMTGVYLIVASMPFMNIGFKHNNAIRLVDEFIPIGVIPIVVTALIFSVKRIVNFGGNRFDAANDDFGFGGENAFLAMILLFILVSLSWSLDPTHGVAMIFLLSCCLWIYKSIPLMITSEKDVRRIFWVILAISPVLIGLLLASKYYHGYSYKVKVFKDTFFVFFFHSIVASSGKIRLGGFAPANIAANILGILLFVMIYLSFRVNWLIRALFGVYAMVIMYCLIKTGSKAGLATFMIGVMALLGMVPDFRKRLLKFIYGGVMIVGLFLVVAGQALLKRIELIISGKVTDDRIGWWAKGFRHLYDTHFVGMGAGGFPKLIDPVPAAHSFYLSVLFDYGFVGVILFTGLLALIVRRIRRTAPMIDGDMKIAFYCLMAEMVSLSVHAAVDADYIYVPFWLLLGVMLGIGRIAQTKAVPVGVA